MPTDVCYPPGADWLCGYTQAELDEMRADADIARVMERSDALAWNTLSALVGYRLSLCPTLLRPCLARCQRQTWEEAPVVGGSGWQPFISGGVWYNGCGCKKDDCSCTSLCEVILPGPAGSITNIWMNGALLSPSAYRVDNANRLVRQDGDCWPICQDMGIPPADDAGVGNENTFVVEWYPGIAPNDLFRYAAGVLATEFFKACSGKNCRLPQGVTSISRNGISMEIPTGLFPGGGTGIREVDAVIRIYNPNGLTMGSRVLSPDSRRGRTQTWGGA
jgi:hypothetical protein